MSDEIAASPADPGMPEQPEGGAEATRHTVLEVFGVKLEVTNSRLAELLTMDAGEALTTDLKDLAGSDPAGSPACEQAAEPDTDVITEEDAERRREVRRSVQETGALLGFEASPDGMWLSPMGIGVLTRVIDRPVTYPEACRFVGELASQRDRITDRECAGLFVAASQQSVDMFTTAIRQQRLHHLIRAISVDDLRSVRDLYANGTLDHQAALALFVPVANIDAGSIIRRLSSAT
jgi:hypothetical protein